MKTTQNEYMQHKCLAQYKIMLWCSVRLSATTKLQMQCSMFGRTIMSRHGNQKSQFPTYHCQWPGEYKLQN